MADDKSTPTSPPEPQFSSSTIHGRTSEEISESSPSRPESAAAIHECSPTHLQIFLHGAIEATNPPLRHLASHSTLGSLHSYGTSDVRSNRTKWSNGSSFRPLSTNFEEQRHVGKPGLSITRSTKEWNPIVAQGPKSSSVSSFQGHSKRLSHLSVADQSFVTQSGVSTQIHSDTLLAREDHRQEATEGLEDKNQIEEKGDVNVYPGPLPLTILIIGLCLSVFLISLDRTIITTVYLCPIPLSSSILNAIGHSIHYE